MLPSESVAAYPKNEGQKMECAKAIGQKPCAICKAPEGPVLFFGIKGCPETKNGLKLPCSGVDLTSMPLMNGNEVSIFHLRVCTGERFSG